MCGHPLPFILHVISHFKEEEEEEEETLVTEKMKSIINNRTLKKKNLNAKKIGKNNKNLFGKYW